METKYRSIIKEHKLLTDHNEKIRKELTQLKTEYHCFQTSVELDRTTTEKLNNDISIKNEHLNSYAEKFAKLKIKNDELTKRISYLEKHNVRTTESSNYNVKALENLETTNTSLNKNNEELKNMLEDYESELKDYNLLQNENKRLQNALKKREKDVEMNRLKGEEHEHSLRDKSNIEYANELLVKKVADLKKIIDGFEKDGGMIVKLRDENNTLKLSLKKKDDQINELSKRLFKDVEYNEQNNEEVNEIIEDLKTKNQTLYTTNAEYILRIEQLEQDLRNTSYKDTNNEKLKSVLSKRDTEILELTKKIEYLEGNIAVDDSSLIKIKSLQNELDNARQELEDMQGK